MDRRLLVIDDDEVGCRLLRAIFAPEGFEVIAVPTGEAGIDRARSDRPDLVLLDLRLPGLDGIAVLGRLKQVDPDLPVVMLTAHGDVKSAVKATRLGAFDYLTKPIDDEEIVLVVRRALDARALKQEVEALRRQVGASGSLAAQMGSSPQVREVIGQVDIVAASNFSVLVTGETGTGKELVAQAIHRQSERRTKPYIAIDCGAIPEPLLESELFGHERGAFTGADRRKTGSFQLANGGTLFLDEIGNLPVGPQAKLLRVLESHQVQPVGATKATPTDVRFITATNEDLHGNVTAGKFRADLYFRLAQYTIRLPPLRERTSDIPYLAQRFLEEAAVELRHPVQQIAPEALELLHQHRWPGNVRELRNVVRQAVLETKDFTLHAHTLRKLLAATPATTSAGKITTAAGESLKEIAAAAARDAERRAIGETLHATGGNKSQAAKALKTDYKTLHVKMKLLGIRGRDFGP